MKPGLLPLMLLRDMYAVMAFLAPTFPVSKTVTKIGAVGLSVAGLGPASKTVESVGPASLTVEVPT